MRTVAVVAVLFVVLFYLALISAAIVFYIIQARGMYKISKRRNVSNPWMAWVPVLNVWNLGCVANAHDATQGQNKKWNLLLIILYGAFGVIYTAFYVVFAVFMAGIRFDSNYFFERLIGSGIALILIVMILTIVLIAVLVTFLVFYSICLFKTFNSAVPDRAVAYLILSLLVPFAEPICVAKAANADCYMSVDPVSPEI